VYVASLRRGNRDERLGPDRARAFVTTLGYAANTTSLSAFLAIACCRQSPVGLHPALVDAGMSVHARGGAPDASKVGETSAARPPGQTDIAESDAGVLQGVPSSVEYPSPLVREEQWVVIGGETEQWRLEWAAPPISQCGPGNDSWISCPCWGFAFGEAGDLSVVRLRKGHEIDRLRLTPFFTAFTNELAAMQRWAPTRDDWEHLGEPDRERLAVKRPAVCVMRFADYDHDGMATEFYLQTSAFPCAHTEGVVVGVSKKNPRLHAFGTARSPNRPLVLSEGAWSTLKLMTGPEEIVDWQCGDHGAETEMRLRLNWSAAGIDIVSREVDCRGDAQPHILREHTF
jgi:hypothetical protein